MNISNPTTSRWARQTSPRLINHREATRRLSHAVKGEPLEKVIRLLFDAQDRRPMFHVEGTELPLCWNSPRDWDKDYVKYEWGHLLSRNQNAPDSQPLQNLGLYSARCNQHIQASLDVQELMVYGGIIALRVSLVLTKRRLLFASPEWKAALSELS